MGLGILGLKPAAPSHLIPQVSRDMGSWPYLTDGETEAWNRKLASPDLSGAGQSRSAGDNTKRRTYHRGSRDKASFSLLNPGHHHPPPTAKALPPTELVACGHARCFHLWELDSGIYLSSQK